MQRDTPPDLELRRARFPARRAGALALVAIVTVIACNDESRTAGSLLCGSCWIVSGAALTVAEDEAAALASCGECAPGTSCNRLHRPPICARSPGRDGDRCGTFQIDTEYRCDLGYECRDGACRSLPGLGAPCAFDAFESWHAGPASFCARGLVCGTDALCRPGCSTDCPDGTRCSPWTEPPSCMPDPAPTGARCGPVHPAWAIACEAHDACVDRGAGARCELGGPGPECGYRHCPLGFSCDTALQVCVADEP